MASTSKGKAPASEPRVTRSQATASDPPPEAPTKSASEAEDSEEEEDAKAMILQAFEGYVQKLEERLEDYPSKQAFDILKQLVSSLQITVTLLNKKVTDLESALK